MYELTASAPRHLWVVGVLSLLSLGAFDYVAKRFGSISTCQFTPEQIDYFYGLPAWAKGSSAIAV